MMYTRLMVSLTILLILGGIGIGLAQDAEADDVADGATDLGTIGAEGGEISYETDLMYPGDIDWFKFTVEAPTADLIISSDMSSMRLIVFDENMNYIDDDEELLKLTAEAGTYFVRADSISSETDNYTIAIGTVLVESESNDCISNGNDLGILANTTMISGSINPMADTDFFLFEIGPESQGYVSITGETSELEVDEEDQEDEEDEDDWWYYVDSLSLVLYEYNDTEGGYIPIEDSTYEIEADLPAGRYAIRAQSEYAYSTLSYVLVISFLNLDCDVEPNDDFEDEEVLDLGNLTQGGELTAAGCILPEGDEDYYRLVVEEDLEVTIETSGDDFADSYLHLYDDEEEMITSDDDDGDGSWSLIEEDLEPGTYYIMVRAFGSSTFQYTLTVEG